MKHFEIQLFRAAPGKGRLEFEASITNLFSSIIGTMVMEGDPVLPLQVRLCISFKFFRGRNIIIAFFVNFFNFIQDSFE